MITIGIRVLIILYQSLSFSVISSSAVSATPTPKPGMVLLYLHW